MLALAAGSSARRGHIPPLLSEQGLPNYDVARWFAVVGPAKLPREQVKRIHDAFVAAFNSPELKDAMNKHGNAINPTTPDVAAQYFRSELARYVALVKKADVKVE